MTAPRTATELLWLVAGQPLPESPIIGAAPDARCWWCAQPLARTGGFGRTVRSLSDTIHDAVFPAIPASPALCAACGWSLSDWVSLPAEVWGPSLDAKLDGDGRIALALGDDRGAPVNVCRHPAGVAVFARPKQGPAGRESEGAWQALRPAIAETGETEGSPLPLIEVMPREQVGAAMVGKFRNYDHVGILVAEQPPVWRALKARRPSDRALIRGLCLAPPPGLWVCAMGDGQKHAAIHAPVSDGRLPVQAVYLDGSGVVHFEPAELAAVIGAFEALIAAGIHPDEIGAGQYRPASDVDRRAAIRTHEPVLAPVRGSGLFALADMLRRSTEDVRSGQALDPAALTAAPSPTPVPSPDPVPAPPLAPALEHTHGLRPAPVPADAVVPPRPSAPLPQPGPADGDRGRRPAARQLGLFG
jgi:hypothetical protein